MATVKGRHLSPGTERIWDFLKKAGPVSPRLIADYVNRSSSWVSTQLKLLQEFGLVLPVSRGIYQVIPELAEGDSEVSAWLEERRGAKSRTELLSVLVTERAYHALDEAGRSGRVAPGTLAEAILREATNDYTDFSLVDMSSLRRRQYSDFYGELDRMATADVIYMGEGEWTVPVCPYCQGTHTHFRPMGKYPRSERTPCEKAYKFKVIEGWDHFLADKERVNAKRS